MIKNNLKKLRKDSDMSQETLANKIGVSRQAIISIENYKYTPSLSLAFKLSKIFGVTIENIFIDDGSENIK